MFDYIKGVFTGKISGSKGCYATVEAGGIGYRFEITERDFENLSDLNTEIKMYSVLLHREDKMSLCGFLRRDERDIFNILTSVSGVGAKMALTLVNSFEVSDLAGFVIEGNYKELTKAKGVGPKLAQKIILELKDKLTSYEGVEGAKKTVSVSSQNVEDAQTVLLSLGYNNDEVNSAIEKTLSKIPHSSSAEEILKESLRLLSI